MQAFYEIPGLNVYIQLVVTIISISVHLFKTRNINRQESVIEIITIYTIGLSGWFIIMKFIFGWGAGYTHILHMLQHNNFSPSNTGIIVYWDFLFPVFMIALYLLNRREQKYQYRTERI